CHPTQKVVIGVKASRGLAFGALDFGLLQLRRNCTHYAHSHSVLQIEYVFKTTLEPVCPEMSGRCSIDELSSNAHSVRRLAYAAFEHVAHSKLLAHLLNVDDPIFVSKTRVACDYEQPRHAG